MLRAVPKIRNLNLCSIICLVIVPPPDGVIAMLSSSSILTLKNDVQVVLGNGTVWCRFLANIPTGIFTADAMQNQTIVAVKCGCGWDFAIFASPVQLHWKGVNFIVQRRFMIHTHI